ncbi:MAG TPA: hypothetical protein PKC82_07815, partial [Chitinophagaceae bacterium]|nr:hypothetical protein [Chitinophagaceae bacterium]
MHSASNDNSSFIEYADIFNISEVIYYRLIALWVLCEALLGSIIFTFRIPVSGLVIGSCAISCISLIAWYYPVKGAIIKATIIVAIFKMMLTPQALPTAYIAVFFQGLMGELLFWNRKNYKLACITFALLALLESALQRILILTIVYGNDIWTVFNKFVQKLMGAASITNYSYLFIISYLLLHVVTALFVGITMGRLPQKLSSMYNLLEKYSIAPAEISNTTLSQIKRKRRGKMVLLFILVILLLMYIQTFFKIGEPILPQNQLLRIIIRSIIIILSWYFFISPVLKKWLRKWLMNKKQQSARQVQQVVNLLPTMQNMIAKSWTYSAEKKYFKRLFLFFQILLVNTFNT